MADPMATSRVVLGLTGLSQDLLSGNDTCGVSAHLFWDSGSSIWRIVSTANPMPTTGSGGGGGGGGSSGSVTAAGTNGSLAQAMQGITGGVPVPVSGTFWPGTQPVSGTVAISGTTTISGSVSITGSVAVTGTFFQATQPVSLASLPALPAGTNAIGSLTNTDFGPEGQKKSYHASVLFTPPTTLGVWFQMQGSASGTIRIRSIRIKAAAAATAAVLGMAVSKYSTGVSGGTQVAITSTKADSTNAADIATSVYFSTMGTAGTLTGQLDADPYYVGVGANSQAEYVINFGQDGTQACVLRGTGEYLCIANVTAAFSANTSLSVNVSYTWE